MDLHLISFDVCPFVHRARIALHLKGLDCRVTFIDFVDKPEWFLAISPRGKVPVLLVDEQPVWESQAICELLEELAPEPALLPVGLVERARDRAWFTFLSEALFQPTFRVLTTSSEETLRAGLGQLHEALRRCDAGLQGRQWLSGDGSSFGMADLAAAPILQLLRVMGPQLGLTPDPALVRLAAWTSRLLSHESVVATGSENLFEGTLELMRAAGSVRA